MEVIASKTVRCSSPELIIGSREIWRSLFSKLKEAGFKIGQKGIGTGWNATYSVPSRIYITSIKSRTWKEKFKQWIIDSFAFPGKTIAVIQTFPEVMIHAFAEDWLPTTRDFGKYFGISKNNFVIEVAEEDENTAKLQRIFENLQGNFGFSFYIKKIPKFDLRINIGLITKTDCQGQT